MSKIKTIKAFKESPLPALRPLRLCVKKRWEQTSFANMRIHKRG